MTIPQLRPLPGPTAKWVNPQTGQIDPVVYQYFEQLDRIIRALIAASEDHETRITALEP